MFLLSLLLKIVKFILNIIIKIVSFILFGLYFWIPAFVAVLYAVGSATLSYSYIDYMPYFSILMTCAFALSVILTFNKYFNKKSPNKVKKTKKRQVVLAQDDVIPQVVHLVPPQYVKSPAYQSMPMPKNRVFLDQRYGNLKKQKYEDKHDEAISEPAILEPKFVQATADEPVIEVVQKPLPKLFRTRKDPTLFIAQYDDKIEYYRKIASGDYILVSVEDNEIA